MAVGFRNARLEGTSWGFVSHLLQSWVTLCETSLRRVQGSLALRSSAYQGPQYPSSLKSLTCSERWKCTAVLCQKDREKTPDHHQQLRSLSVLFGTLFSFAELPTQTRELQIKVALQVPVLENWVAARSHLALNDASPDPAPVGH